ncbi:hypothetical protein FPCIR_12083 [Fusarium pseudocircinatum]|uniref:Uncharacterized protein n=1 Tax=Fusarium pseudocircinatum TaxID=56676 RepID=A0A8H5KNC5_9HYPO|nr:hypothetical protein FPCIR_12083 [Fusarium pseudocircinatum]
MSARIARSSMALRPSLPIQRGFRTTRLLQHNEKEPIGPKSSDKPMSKGGNAQIVMLGSVGLAIGAFFFLLTGKPEKAKEQPIDGTSKPHERVRG